MADSEKKYTQNGKTIKIIPLKRVKKTEAKSTETEEESGEEMVKSEKVKKATVKKPKKSDLEKGIAKFAVDDKVSLKNIPAEYANAGFAEAVITKVFKSTYDQTFRYSIKSTSGHEMAMVKEEQLKPRKTNFTK